MKKKLFRVSTVATSLNTFCKGQLKMLSQYYDVVAVSSPDKELDEIRDREGVRTIPVHMERQISIFSDCWSLVRMIYVMAKEKPYIVHSMTPKAGLISMLAAWITRVPIRMHTFTGLVFLNNKGFKRKLLIFIDKLVCACANYVNPEGVGVKNTLLEYKITKKPLYIIGNGNVRGVDMEYYSRSPEVMQKANELIDKSCFTFCFVGRIVSDKGVNELVSSFEKLQNIHENIRLLFIGDFENNLDPLLPDTLIHIEQNKKIVFYGSQTDVRPYYAASDAFVFPTRFKEGVPNVVLEAGAMGLPCIVTNVNGCNEIIINNQNGVIIPPNDEVALFNTMKQFVEDHDLVNELSNNARRLIDSRYEQKKFWNALVQFYNDISDQQGKE